MSMVAAYSEQSRLPKSGGARAAILLLTVGAEAAAKILRHLSPEEIRSLKASAAGLNTVSPEVIEQLVEEFQDAFKRVPGLSGPSDQIDLLLQNALGEEEFRTLFDENDMPFAGFDEGSGRSVWEEMEGVAVADVAPKLSLEHPQVVALLLSKISAETASLIIREFEAAFRNDIMRRMLSLRPLADPINRLFEMHVRQAFLSRADDAEHSGSHAVLADIVNRLDKTHSEELLQLLRSSAPGEADTLEKFLFAFEDVTTLPQKARLVLFDVVATETVILALRGAAAAELREAMLSAMGARAKRMVEAELSQEAEVTTAEIEGARRRIAAEALRLASEGRIELREAEDA